MVLMLPFLGAVAILSAMTSAMSPPGNATSEPAASTPYGTPITQSQTASAQVTSPSSNSYLNGYSNMQLAATSASNSDGSYYYNKQQATTTSPTSSPTHVSGGSSWQSSGYNNCVSQCMAKYNAPSSNQYKVMGGKPGGHGVTHTVIVAPTQGVLRYVPFAVQASVGDTIKFMWGANNHTVTKGSALEPCNKTSDSPFTSGEQNKSFTFTQVVSGTEPTYFFCNTPTHCQKGMFGIINPSCSSGSPTSFANQMQNISAKSPDIDSYAATTQQNTANNSAAWKWGSTIDLSTLPDWAHESVAANILFTRNFLGSNREVLKPNGFVDLSTSSFIIPPDLGAAINNDSTSGTSALLTSSLSADPGSYPSSTASSAAATSAAATPTPMSGLQGNGASELALSRLLFSLLAIVATFVAL